MAFSHGDGGAQSDANNKKDQIITKFFAKTLHIILESRVPSFMSSRNYSEEHFLSSPSSSSSSSSSCRPRDNLFNLALPECPAALENINFWQHSSPNTMVVDVVLVQCAHNCEPEKYMTKEDVSDNQCLAEHNPNCLNLDPENDASGPKTEKVIERWVVLYESKKSRESGSGRKRAGGNLHSVYKKSILLRSLYTTLRLLPAYKLYRDLISSGRIRTYALTHYVNSFIEPFTRGEEADMQQFGFTPVDTSCGRLCISVSYKCSLLDLSSEVSTSISPQFIPDYVGSPLADPLKRFTSLPVSHNSPSCSPLSKRHSWSYDDYRASPPSTLPSPSITYSDSHATELDIKRTQPMSLPHHLPRAAQANAKYPGYDEYLPSSPFSPSTSPSPPLYNNPTDPSSSLLRHESAPVRIPASMDLSSPLSKQVLPPSPPLRKRTLGAKTNKHSDSSDLMIEKFSLRKDNSGRFSRLRLPSSSSSQVSVLGSSGNLSYQEEYDRVNFDCHFADDVDDMIGPGSRGGSFDQRRQPSRPFEQGGSPQFRPSQNAALGALVLMLNKAEPLHHDFSGRPTNQLSSAISGPDTAPMKEHCEKSEEEPSNQSSTVCSSAMARKTTADALAEMREYGEVKEQLMRQRR